MQKETKDALKNMANLADLVREARETARCAAVVGRPEGAVTIQEYADGPPAIGRSTATDQLKKAITAGLMEKIYAVVAGTDGKPRRTQFFRKVKR